MAEIRPFRALRFTDAAGRLQELTCPPYDIISESQRLSYLKRNPHNIIRLELPRDGEDPYAAAGDVLREWLREGILQRDDQPAFYIYEIEFDLEGRSDISAAEGAAAAWPASSPRSIWRSSPRVLCCPMRKPCPRPKPTG